MTLANLPTADLPTAPTDPEVALIVAVIRQAFADLTPTARHEHRAAAARFWRGEDGTLAWFCELLGVDAPAVQRRIAARYPQVLVPAPQLALALEEAS